MGRPHGSPCDTGQGPPVFKKEGPNNVTFFANWFEISFLLCPACFPFLLSSC